MKGTLFVFVDLILRLSNIINIGSVNMNSRYSDRGKHQLYVTTAENWIAIGTMMDRCLTELRSNYKKQEKLVAIEKLDLPK